MASSGLNLFNSATDEDGLTATEVGFSILIAAAGPAGGKLINLVAKTKKAKKTLSVLENASGSAFQAAKNIRFWTPKNKHMLSTTAKSKARFNTDNEDLVRSWVVNALRSPRAQFIPEPGKTDRFRMIVDMGQEIGIKGQRRIRVIVAKDGNVINAFPVHLK